MCSTCGCAESDVRLTRLGTAAPTAPDRDTVHDHDHDHDHDHGRGHGHSPEHGHVHKHLEQDARIRTHTLELEVAVLAKNDALAATNRDRLGRDNITALNLMSSPGSGKTTLLERTIATSTRPMSVIEGDQETLFDAERIRAAGARVVQVNTGAGCHLDASMVGRALDDLSPEADGIVFIENVGNLVCPAMFDLGEARKVVVISVTEGDDKPLKYPHMFTAADLIVVNKIDLLPYVDFDLARLSRDARRLKPCVQVLALSAKTGENFDAWLTWIGQLDRSEQPSDPPEAPNCLTDTDSGDSDGGAR